MLGVGLPAGAAERGGQWPLQRLWCLWCLGRLRRLRRLLGLLTEWTPGGPQGGSQGGGSPVGSSRGSPAGSLGGSAGDCPSRGSWLQRCSPCWSGRARAAARCSIPTVITISTGGYGPTSTPGSRMITSSPSPSGGPASPVAPAPGGSSPSPSGVLASPSAACPSAAWSAACPPAFLPSASVRSVRSSLLSGRRSALV